MKNKHNHHSPKTRILVDCLAFAAGALGAVPIALVIAVPFIVG